jgi:hypothetical protein
MSQAQEIACRCVEVLNGDEVGGGCPGDGKCQSTSQPLLCRGVEISKCECGVGGISGCTEVTVVFDHPEDSRGSRLVYRKRNRNHASSLLKQCERHIAD